MNITLPLAALLCAVCHATAATYFVDNGNPKASDTNQGTEAAPWKSISRSAGAKELQPGDTVLIKSGVYRESVHISVSGTEGKPITFAAAPGARVVIKGSEIVKGIWAKITEDAGASEPFPGAFTGVWKTQLGEEQC